MSAEVQDIFDLSCSGHIGNDGTSISGAITRRSAQRQRKCSKLRHFGNHRRAIQPHLSVNQGSFPFEAQMCSLPSL